MSEYDVLAHGDTLPAVPMPPAEPAEPVEVVEVVEKQDDDAVNFEALIARERERLADAETRLDEVLLTTVWDGQGKTIARAEEAVAIARRKIRSLELRRLEALATADAKLEAARRAEVSAVAQQVDDTIAELSERCRAFREGIDAVKGALHDIALACERIRKLRKGVKLRTRNRDIATFEAGGDVTPHPPAALIAAPIATNLRDVARVVDGVAVALGLPLVQPVDKTAPPPARDFEVALQRFRKEFLVDPDQALSCTGRWGGGAPADWGTDL